MAGYVLMRHKICVTDICVTEYALANMRPQTVPCRIATGESVQRAIALVLRVYSACVEAPPASKRLLC
ncbi:hypothetical protein HNI00_08595 [Thermoleptolyngbya oregonensis NK1-22]|uniref:Uncharacterized protein n=1 Tax=Thermoleptolyngbya oregonensis NK1-22 TaxID=2547457 RepID=A0AA97B9T3_9CYAN|nr:hypothetical protein [Thermoleptolyngbya oregonensis]WOB43210.1 hypothetical protein HNI00_08595 [Thermoleptolyngbya oregonensis NK1-22]